MKLITFSFIALVCGMPGCSVSFKKPPVIPGLSIGPGTRSFVLIEGGIIHTPGLAITKKRQEVVKEIRNEYLGILSAGIQKHLLLICHSDTTLSEDEKKKLLQKDSTVIANLEKRYDSSIILILKDCYSGFRQEGVNKETARDGTTSKIAEYSVFFDTHWIVLQAKTIRERNIEASNYHSSRSIQSGLLARGPGFQANKKDIMEMAIKNAWNVVQLFQY